VDSERNTELPHSGQLQFEKSVALVTVAPRAEQSAATATGHYEQALSGGGWVRVMFIVRSFESG
jgi:hypothetical protein